MASSPATPAGVSAAVAASAITAVGAAGTTIEAAGAAARATVVAAAWRAATSVPAASPTAARVGAVASAAAPSLGAVTLLVTLAATFEAAALSSVIDFLALTAVALAWLGAGRGPIKMLDLRYGHSER